MAILLFATPAFSVSLLGALGHCQLEVVWTFC